MSRQLLHRSSRVVFGTLVALLSCSSPDDGSGPDPDPVAPPPPVTTAPTQLSFWTDGAAGDAITVTVDGIAVGQINASFSSTPQCGQIGTLTVTTTPGTHMVAGSGGGLTWSSTAMAATQAQCNLFRFNLPVSIATRLMFWLNGSVSGPVTVSLDGVPVGQLTTSFTSGPTCGAAGAVTVPAAAGSHTLTASGGGRTWGPAQVTSTSGLCSSVQLNATGTVGSGSGGGGGGSTNYSLPATTFLSNQGESLSAQCAWATREFTISRTTTFDFRFVAWYNAQTAILPVAQLNNFKNCQGFQGYGLLEGRFGTQTVTLAAGTYHFATRNAQSLPNRFSVELDYAIPEVLINPEGGKTFNRTSGPNYTTYVTKGSRYTQTFTIQSGYRYFIDGVNTGELECFIIPSSQVSAFMAGQTFQQHSQYQETGAYCPGLNEIILPPGTYAVAVRNNSSQDAALTFTIEEWRINP